MYLFWKLFVEKNELAQASVGVTIGADILRMPSFLIDFWSRTAPKGLLFSAILAAEMLQIATFLLLFGSLGGKMGTRPLLNKIVSLQGRHFSDFGVQMESKGSPKRSQNR